MNLHLATNSSNAKQSVLTAALRRAVPIHRTGSFFRTILDRFLWYCSGPPIKYQINCSNRLQPLPPKFLTLTSHHTVETLSSEEGLRYYQTRQNKPQWKIYCKGAQIMEARSTGRMNYVPRRQKFEGPQCGTSFRVPCWRLEFWSDP
jgi:hypothetical protein